MTRMNMVAAIRFHGGGPQQCYVREIPDNEESDGGVPEVTTRIGEMYADIVNAEQNGRVQSQVQITVRRIWCNDGKLGLTLLEGGWPSFAEE